MLISPNLEDVTDPIQPGTYKCHITGAEVKQSQSGNQYINWTLETFDEPEAKNNGRRIYHMTPIAGKGAFRLTEFYQAVTRQTLSKENPKFDTDQLLGGKVEVTLVGGVDQNGEPRRYPDVKTVRPVLQ